MPSARVALIASSRHFFLKRLRRASKIPETFLRSRHYDGPLKIAGVYQTFNPLSNQVYNNLMGRNHFSKYGGPYFINDGISGHPEKSKKVDKRFAVILSTGILTIAIHIALIITLIH